MIKLFIYGTLAKDKPITHKLPGYMMFNVRGQTFDFPYIQPYPWTDNLPAVYGTVVEVDESQIPELDKYEGVERLLYERVQALAYSVNGNIAAPEPVQVYVGGKALVHEPIPSGLWRK